MFKDSPSNAILSAATLIAKCEHSKSRVSFHSETSCMPLCAGQNKIQAFKPKLKKNRRKLSTSASAARKHNNVDSLRFTSLLLLMVRIERHKKSRPSQACRNCWDSKILLLSLPLDHETRITLFKSASRERCFQRFFFKDFVQRLLSKRFLSRGPSKDFVHIFCKDLVQQVFSIFVQRFVQILWSKSLLKYCFNDFSKIVFNDFIQRFCSTIAAMSFAQILLKDDFQRFVFKDFAPGFLLKDCSGSL